MMKWIVFVLIAVATVVSYIARAFAQADEAGNTLNSRPDCALPLVTRMVFYWA
jgi:hypothetical protein